MPEKLVIAIVVILALFAHWVMFKWIRFKIDEGLIVKYLTDTASDQASQVEEVANATKLRSARVKYVCIKSKSISLHPSGTCSLTQA